MKCAPGWLASKTGSAVKSWFKDKISSCCLATLIIIRLETVHDVKTNNENIQFYTLIDIKFGAEK